MRRWMMLSSMVFLSFVLSVIPARGAGSFTFTAIDFPVPVCCGSTLANGINKSGQIVGSYTVRDTIDNIYKEHGFLLAAGSFSTIDVPGAAWTTADGINDSGQIVGTYNKNGTHGFLLVAGSFSTIDFPDAYSTFPIGINNFGEIVGIYQDNSTRQWHGFLLARYDRGIFTRWRYSSINYPGATFTYAQGINDSGQIVGTYYRNGTHGFLLVAGSFSTIDVPGARETGAWGINNAGQIVGGYADPDGYGHGFLRDAQGGYVSLDSPEPSAYGTAGHGISNPNPKGRYSIVGWYYIGLDGFVHGFVATPCGRLCLPLPDPPLF